MGKNFISAEIYQTTNKEGRITYIYNYAGGPLVYDNLYEAINAALIDGYRPTSFSKDIISFIK